MDIIPEKHSGRARNEPKRPTASRQRRPTSPCEWTSVETTSTMRRQSVKDLYYGIQRPARLVSLENVDFDPEETPRPSVQRRYCHLCPWFNPLGTVKCRCGHILCGQCDDLTPGAIATSDGSAECAENVPHSKGGHLLEDTTRSQPLNRQVPKQAHLEQQNLKHQVSNNSLKRRHGRLKWRNFRILSKYLIPYCGCTFVNLLIRSAACSDAGEPALWTTKFLWSLSPTTED
jgi:hypothetical protein